MSVTLRFGPGDQCRFAISPLGETADALRVLAWPGPSPYHLAWQRQVRGQLPGLGLRPLLALLSLRGYQPDFVTPAPDGPFTEIGAELDRVRATPAGRVAAELGECRRRHPGAAAWREPGLSGDPAQVRDRLAALLERAWTALVGPWWPRLRDVLDADITVRARQLADEGLARTLNDLDPRISWQDGLLRLHTAAGQDDEELDAGRAPLVLIPTALGWPHAAVAYHPPAVIYPARGIGLLWDPPARPGSALARLIGATRARVLGALTEPASTTGLAARTAIPVSSVSEHLAVLRDGGLITTRRTGRFLVHQRTALGIALCGTPGPPTAPGPPAPPAADHEAGPPRPARG
jgi:DNA-binding transcriptional ArsR family regulator